MTEGIYTVTVGAQRFSYHGYSHQDALQRVLASAAAALLRPTVGHDVVFTVLDEAHYTSERFALRVVRL